MSEVLLLTLQHHVKYACNGYNLYLIWLRPPKPAVLQLWFSVWWEWRRWDLLVNNNNINRAWFWEGISAGPCKSQFTASLSVFSCSINRKSGDVTSIILEEKDSQWDLGGSPKSSYWSESRIFKDRDTTAMEVYLVWLFPSVSYPVIRVACIHDIVMLSAPRQ